MAIFYNWMAFFVIRCHIQNKWAHCTDNFHSTVDHSYIRCVCAYLVSSGPWGRVSPWRGNKQYIHSYIPWYIHGCNGMGNGAVYAIHTPFINLYKDSVWPGIWTRMWFGIGYGTGMEFCMGFGMEFSMGLTEEKFKLLHIKTKDEEIPKPRFDR